MTTTTNWENKFDKKRPTMEFTNSNGEGATNDFGYKYTELDEIHEVTDWGNIKSFIRSLLAQQRLELLDQVRDRLKKLMDGDRAIQLGDCLETFNLNGKRSCMVCGYEPEIQRKMVLDTLSALRKEGGGK